MQNRPMTAQDIARDSQTLEEASRRAEGAPRANDAPIQFPTWRYARDGRTAIVSSPQELEELEADGGGWQDHPHPAGTQFIPDGTRTFEAPVGTVDARGAAARVDRPQPEVALTSALPRNEAGSIPGQQAERVQRQMRQQGQTSESPMAAEMARLQSRIEELERENGNLKVQQKKAANTDRKTGVDKRSAGSKKAKADARKVAKRQSDAEKQAAAEEEAERQSAIRRDAEDQ
jgi:hypothetical protein